VPGPREKGEGAETWEKGDSDVKGASMGDWGQWPEEAMLPGEGTEDSGERGERRGPLPRPFCPKETLCGMAGSGTCW